MGKLIINGNSVYEIDEASLRKEKEKQKMKREEKNNRIFLIRKKPK